jgi:tripartite ATP-independent transporter DctM subunit
VTEAAAVGVVYSLFVGFIVTKELSLKAIPVAIIKSAIITGTVAILFGAGNTISWIFAINQMPKKIAEAIIAVTTDPMVFLLLTIGIMTFFGCIMEPNAAIILVAPILYPIAVQLGIHPFQFGLIFVMTIEIGLLTPPVGVLLFIVSSIGNIDLYSLVKAVWPFVVCQVLVVVLAAFLPGLTLFVPKLFGF